MKIYVPTRGGRDCLNELGNVRWVDPLGAPERQIDPVTRRAFMGNAPTPRSLLEDLIRGVPDTLDDVESQAVHYFENSSMTPDFASVVPFLAALAIDKIHPARVCVVILLLGLFASGASPLGLPHADDVLEAFRASVPWLTRAAAPGASAVDRACGWLAIAAGTAPSPELAAEAEAQLAPLIDDWRAEFRADTH